MGYWRPPSLDEAAGDHHLAWYSYSQETIYDDRSFVTEVRDANGQTWWSDPEYNVFGQLISYKAGNLLTTESEYDDTRHVLERITVKAGATERLKNSYEFDSIGNLTQREDELKNLTENLSYDNLNRLSSSSVASGATLTMGYDDFGNINTRTSSAGIGSLGHIDGSYAYTSGTNRVSGAGGRNFFYNDNGSISSVTGSSSSNITWAAFNKPYTIESNNKRSAFSYDTGNGRVTQTRETDVGTNQWRADSRKTYVGSLFEQEQAWVPATGSATTAEQLDRTKWDITSTRIYISTPAGVVGSWISEVGEVYPKKTLFHRDHLGSVIAETDLADANGTISKEFSYDAWGLARDASDWEGEPSPNPPSRIAADRGFTGHEMLDDLGLIHMNGRIYDPLLGRMLSADPNIQAPSNLQNYNRYSYVLNNPVSMTDPSGFFFKKLFKKKLSFLKKYWQTIVTVALTFIPVIGWYLAAAFTITMGAIQGGVKGALIATAGVVLFGVGGGINPADLFKETFTALSQATLQGVAQGGFAELAGGDFQSGFLGGFSGTLVGSALKNPSVSGALGKAGLNNPVGRVVTAAVAGGTVSEIGGGKFENGAVSASFGAMLREVVDHQVLPERSRVEADRAKSDEVAIAYVGGAMDSKTKIVKNFSVGNGKYFTWDQSKDLASWIDANAGKEIWVLGHSYGADTAAWVVARGHYVDRLITVDPVSWVRPNFDNVAKFSGHWINFDSEGAGFTWPNVVSTLGGAWNKSPKGYVDSFETRNSDHVGILYDVMSGR